MPVTKAENPERLSRTEGKRIGTQMKDLSDAPHRLVDLKEISEDPGPYCMSFRFDLNPLIRSIEKWGLLFPPFTAKNESGNMDVVIGFRRILALKSLKWVRAPMIDLSEKNFSALDLLLLNLCDNLAVRSFNDVEKGMILNRLKPHLSEKLLRKEYLPLLGIPARESIYHVYENLEELDNEIKVSLADGTIPFKTVKALQEIDPESRSILFEWIRDLRFNVNQQGFFIETTVDIAIKEGISIPQLMREPPMLKIREDTELNNPQKARRLLAHLRSRRFPLLSHSEKAFEQKICNLGLPDNVKISHPPFFESPDYRLEILFKSGKVLDETIKALAVLKELERIGDPWDEVP